MGIEPEKCKRSFSKNFWKLAILVEIMKFSLWNKRCGRFEPGYLKLRFLLRFRAALVRFFRLRAAGNGHNEYEKNAIEFLGSGIAMKKEALSVFHSLR